MALYTSRSGVDNHPEATFLQNLTDIVVRGGVVDLVGGDYRVVQASGGGLNVDVEPGHGYAKGTSTYPIRNTATETVAVSANASGNPRITSIIASVDLSVTPDADGGGDDVHLLQAVNGTPGSSPLAPDTATINSAVGGGGPWIKLADVLVESGATGIATDKITDRRSRVFLASKRSQTTVAYGTPYAPDFEVGDTVMVLTGNITVTAPTNMQVNDWLIVTLVQDSTPRSVTFSGFRVMSADTSMPTGSGKKATYAIKRHAASEYHLYLVGKEYA